MNIELGDIPVGSYREATKEELDELKRQIDENTDKSKSLADGAVQVSGWNNPKSDSISYMYYGAMAEKYGFSLNTPWQDLPEKAQDVILNGTGKDILEIKYDRGNGYGVLKQPFEGILPNVSRRYAETQSDWSKKELEECMATKPCPHCHGQRLSDVSRAVTVGGLSIWQFTELNIDQAMEFVNNLQLTGAQAKIADQIIREIKARLGFLQRVGLPYLTLSRAAATLSGGEAQRIRLATQIGSSLLGVLYILDEPSIGLHQRDNS